MATIINGGTKYAARWVGYGLEIYVLGDKSAQTAFLQGDEANELWDDLQLVEGNDRFTPEQIVDVILGEYL